MNHQFGGQDEINYIRKRFQKGVWDDAEFIAFCNEVRGKGGYVIPAHPFDPAIPFQNGHRNLWPDLYGLEIYNNTAFGNTPPKQIPKTIKELGIDTEKALLMFGGADAHRIMRMTAFMEIHTPIKDNLDYQDQDKSSARIMELLAGGLADGTITSAIREKVTIHRPKSPTLLRAIFSKLDIVWDQLELNGPAAFKLLPLGIGYVLSPRVREMVIEAYKDIQEI